MNVVEPEQIPAMVQSITQSIHQRTPFSVTPFVRRDALPSQFQTPHDFFDAVGARVLATTGKPRYCPLPRHEILMPPIEWLGLKNWQACYCHELLHLSQLSGNWSERLWKSELRAEIGESLLCSLLCILPCSDHTNINNWFGRWQTEIGCDPSLVTTATLSAIDGVEYLIKRACLLQTPEQKETEAALIALLAKAKTEFAA